MSDRWSRQEKDYLTSWNDFGIRSGVFGITSSWDKLELGCTILMSRRALGKSVYPGCLEFWRGIGGELKSITWDPNISWIGGGARRMPSRAPGGWLAWRNHSGFGAERPFLATEDPLSEESLELLSDSSISGSTETITGAFVRVASFSSGWCRKLQASPNTHRPAG